jgi:hypothetical protein
MDRPTKITFAEPREQGIRGVLIDRDRRRSMARPALVFASMRAAVARMRKATY